jgi:hypothetical protein
VQIRRAQRRFKLVDVAKRRQLHSLNHCVVSDMRSQKTRAKSLHCARTYLKIIVDSMNHSKQTFTEYPN